ncbi:hypothetical protein N658DRAFT_487027 [Parathielavia hyrcaniae]|uniref:SMODS and SLOG-associating 2TM effector domain-containing protein n=1 Tax=Parathielavia hyrcaniae TaxID=113614 RepID=A0AAN6Q3I2_9PEZI|nr:hypothetical protein N658DRAFT_487027 [Parathielavia hyrcaniae]
MASSSKNPTPRGGRPANENPPPEIEIYNSEKPAGTPKPPSSPRNAPVPKPLPSEPPVPAHTPAPAPNAGPPVHHRFLTPAEWARVAHGLGAIREGEEQHQVVHPTCWYWPPRGLPEGLYRDVVGQRAKYCVGFQLLSSLHWFLMVLQVMVGAVLTALGSLSTRYSTPITLLAAVNTLGAGLVGLMHNSGLPDRYRMDKAEFIHVEDYIRAVLDTGVVEAQQKAEDVLNECFTRFHKARSTVLSNKPQVYNCSPAARNPNVMVLPHPTVHVRAHREHK